MIWAGWGELTSWVDKKAPSKEATFELTPESRREATEDNPWQKRRRR